MLAWEWGCVWAEQMETLSASLLASLSVHVWLAAVSAISWAELSEFSSASVLAVVWVVWTARELLAFAWGTKMAAGSGRQSALGSELSMVDAWGWSSARPYERRTLANVSAGQWGTS